MENVNLTQLIDLGMQGVLLFLLIMLWRSHEAQAAFIRVLLERMLDVQERAEAQRDAIARANGVDFQRDSSTRIPVMRGQDE